MAAGAMMIEESFSMAFIALIVATLELGGGL
jgi:hypothetical protein